LILTPEGSDGVLHLTLLAS